MHISFTDSDTLGKLNPPFYANWLAHFVPCFL